MAKDQSKTPHELAAKASSVVPPALAKRGLVGITSNLPEGKTIDCAAAFVRVFGDEALAKLSARQRKNPPPKK